MPRMLFFSLKLVGLFLHLPLFLWRRFSSDLSLRPLERVMVRSLSTFLPLFSLPSFGPPLPSAIWVSYGFSRRNYQFFLSPRPYSGDSFTVHLYVCRPERSACFLPPRFRYEPFRLPLAFPQLRMHRPPDFSAGPHFFFINPWS